MSGSTVNPDWGLIPSIIIVSDEHDQVMVPVAHLYYHQTLRGLASQLQSIAGARRGHFMGISVSAALPFPLRLVGGPYSIVSEIGSAHLTFRTERHEHPDQRVHGGGNFDFAVDRHGWASYSHVSAEVEPSPETHPVDTFLVCLNIAIQHLRDDINLFWVHEIEPDDLFQLTVGSEGYFAAEMMTGRTGGVQPGITGLSQEAEAHFKQRLASRGTVQAWRTLQQDAEEALHTGRYEQTVVLSWSAMETAARTQLPRLARVAGLGPSHLWERLKGNAPKYAPYSHEQAVEVAAAKACIRLMCELSDASYDADALAMSIRYAYNLRNRVVHQGFRISRAQARRAFEAVSFVLRASGLATTCASEPFDTSNWIDHFTTITGSLVASLGRATGRLVLYRAVEGREDPLTYPFALARHQNTFVATIPPGISEPVAAALTVINNDSFDYMSRPYPHLSVSATAKRFLVAGLMDQEAAEITRAVYFAFAALRREREAFNVESASDHMLTGLRRTFRQLGHTFDTEDTRFKVIAAWMASYLLRGSALAKQAFLKGLQSKHGRVLQCALDFEKILAGLDPDAPHSMWDVFRAIHGTTMWLDSIVVRCPIERATYGTRRWEFDAG